MNFNLNPNLNVAPEDADFVEYCIVRRLPGQYFYIKEGRAMYGLQEGGITRKGVFWQNTHKTHGENRTYSIRDRALLWLEGDNGLDVCCGIEKVVPGCWGIDRGDDYGERTDADELRDAADLAGHEDGRFDWVFNSHGLEHIAEWEKALSEWVRVLKGGGTIFLYLPWPDRYPPHAAGETPSHVWNPSPEILRRELDKRGVEIIECDITPDRWGCFVIIGRKR